MNERARFFSEMTKGLVDTVKAVSAPLIEETVQKIDRVADSALQLNWVLLTNQLELLPAVEPRYINGEQIIVFRTGEEVKAVHMICPVCSNLFFFYENTDRLRCFTCEKETSLFNGKVSMPVSSYPIRKQGQRYEIGMKVTKR